MGAEPRDRDEVEPRAPRVALLGARAIRRAGWRRFAPKRGRLKALDGYHVVVAGDQAASELEPIEVLDAVASAALVLCLPATPAPLVAKWVRATAARVASPERLEAEVETLLATLGARMPVRLADWCPVSLEPGSACSQFLNVVPALPRPFHATEWASATGLRRPKLYELVRSDLGVTPCEALWWYVRDQVERLRAEGRTIAVTSRVLGFHDKSALEHAWKRRFGTPPPGGS